MDNRRRMLMSGGAEPFTEIDIFNIATYNGWVTPEFRNIFGSLSTKNTDPNGSNVYSLTSEGIRCTKSGSYPCVFAYQGKLINWNILNEMAGVSKGYLKIEAAYPALSSASATLSDRQMFVGFCTYPTSWQGGSSFTTYTYFNTTYKNWHTYSALVYPTNSNIGISVPASGSYKILIRRIYWSANP